MSSAFIRLTGLALPLAVLVLCRRVYQRGLLEPRLQAPTLPLQLRVVLLAELVELTQPQLPARPARVQLAEVSLPPF